MLNKKKARQSYSSMLATLIKENYLSNDSKEIPLSFIHDEAIKIREKKSNLSADMREFIKNMAAYDTIKKTQEAQKSVETKPASSIIMAGGTNE